MSNMSRDSMLRILRESTEQGADEVHFKVPNRPLLRMPTGQLVPTRLHTLSPADVKAAVFALCALGHIEIPLAKITDYEFSFGINQLGRFRCIIYRQRGSLGAVVRRVNTKVPPLSELALDVSVERHVGKPGLMLIAGTNRNAALHALVNGYNARERGNVVILETPLTYLHRDAMSAITHREVGSDAPDFPEGINQAIRLNADLLAVGDIDNADTAERVLTAAEHQMPVLAGVAAPSVHEAPWWITRMFYGEHRTDIQRRLDNVLLFTLCTNKDAPPELLPAEPQTSQSAEEQYIEV